ncbi:YitT family protein [Noviherbaspirillum aerium]|uniref:YitT family protein n=1 Tax=Noviherbaspirillum aerium TaxID=2588497 RepID=UPI00124D5514|nr:YitT family protein [Noviherbaspirillum aerium]
MPLHHASRIDRAGTHTIIEDLQAIGTGTLLAAIGVTVLSKAGLVTGGIVGVALFLQQLTGISFGVFFAAINLPFYVLAVRKKGWGFTVKTLGSVLLLSALCEAIPFLLRLEKIDVMFAAISGGLLAGVGLLILFRHNASLGGFNILCLYLQEAFGLRAGLTQLALDCLVLLLFAMTTSFYTALISLIATVILNLTLASNHRAGRYTGRSAEQC